MWPDSWHAVRRILAVRLDNIGDVILLGPALRALRRALPGAALSLMASPAGAQAAPLIPWIDDVIPYRPVWQDIFGIAFDPACDREMIEELRRRGFDAAFIFTSFPQSPHPAAYLCYLAGIPLRLAQSKEFAGTVLTRWVRPLPDSLHQADRDLFLLESEGFPTEERQLELRIPEEAAAYAQRLLSENGIVPGEDFIFVAPGASCASRRYSARRYKEVIKLLERETGMPVVVAGSEREARFASLAAAGSRVVSLVGRTSLPQMAALIGRARLVVANNSASLHIADALNRPMVILYSGTDLLEQWRPRRAPARLLYRPARCAPCYLFDCIHAMECLDIAPAAVVREAQELLEMQPAALSRVS